MDDAIISRWLAVAICIVVTWLLTLLTLGRILPRPRRNPVPPQPGQSLYWHPRTGAITTGAGDGIWIGVVAAPAIHVVGPESFAPWADWSLP